MPYVFGQQKNTDLQQRPPVVVILGHVDHGKSSLLEAIREDFRITAKESGGITQHVGAYEVEYFPKNEEGAKKITFIDTPGHEAFAAIRSRGTSIADIAVLVVAADEGVKEQTREAIVHIKKAGILLVVAINKIDKPEANPQKVKRELAKEKILIEDMGGTTPVVEVSAKTKRGLEDLLEIILLVAEMEQLKTDTKKPAEGTVIEAYLDSRRGPTATLLVRDGCLRIQDIVATPSSFGRVRILEDFQGHAIETALASMPVIVVGFEEVPRVGERFHVVPDLESALSYKKQQEIRQKTQFVAEEGKKVANIVLKGDVQSSLEAIEYVLREIPQEDLALRILEGGIGDITEKDVELARNAKALLIGFRVKISPQAKKLAEQYKISLRTFDVIYDLVQGVRHFLEKRMEPEVVREDVGKLRVLLVFMTEKHRQIVGGKVIEGEVRKGALVEVWRGEELCGKGRLINLQENKKDIEQARKGQEVGILYEGDGKIMEGDMLVFYKEHQRRSALFTS